MIDKKTNEITILKRINITDMIITRDDFNTQKENVDAVINGKADYCVLAIYDRSIPFICFGIQLDFEKEISRFLIF